MATIKEDYVSFETAKLLKEKGFDEGCSFVVNTISKGVMPVSWPTTNSDIEDEKSKPYCITNSSNGNEVVERSA